MKDIPPEDIEVVALIAEYNDEGEVYPAARLVADYESFTPKCVASYLICLYEVFETIVPESEQNSFQDETVAHFLDMLAKKDQHIEIFRTTINKEKDDNEEDTN